MATPCCPADINAITSPCRKRLPIKWIGRTLQSTSFFTLMPGIRLMIYDILLPPPSTETLFLGSKPLGISNQHTWSSAWERMRSTLVWVMAAREN